MKRLLIVLLAFIVVFSSCLPLIEPSVMESIDLPAVAGSSHAQNTDTSQGIQAADLNMGGNDITNVGLVDGVDVSAIAGGLHAQNTDWTLLDSTGGAALIDDGVLVGDLRTDRWSANDDNTLFGVDVAGGLGGLTGDMNTAYGTQAMYSITSGDANTAVGWRSQRGLTDGDFNTAIGEQSLTALTTGHGNTAVGVSTLASVTTTGYNTGVGADVLWNATSAYNTGVGAFAGAAVVDGGYNTYVGYDAGNDNVSGDNNVAVGAQAGHTNTGSGNVFLGYKAGEDSAAVSNTLYIDNSDDATPLIYGDFSTDTVTINNTLVVNGSFNYGTDAGASDTYAVTITGITAYTTGLPVYFKANTANTGACTLNINSLGAVALKSKGGSSDPENNYIIANEIVHCVYDGTNFQIINPDAEP